MANNRATKSGFAAEAQRKINSKYSEELATEVLEWVKAITGEPSNTNGEMDNFYEMLKDGVLLCKLVNIMKPGSIKKINENRAHGFKCMENIEKFLETAKAMGVPAQETFQTVDLWERQNLNSVVICLQSLGRKAVNEFISTTSSSQNSYIAGRCCITHLGKGRGLRATQGLVKCPTCLTVQHDPPHIGKTRHSLCHYHSLLPMGSAYGQPSIGPKEADKNVRNFSEDQLRASQGVISLQYGSNKGANQSGINFGNTRHM